MTYIGIDPGKNGALAMVEVTGLGGEGGGSVGMPINVTYGGTRTKGTATKGTSGAIEFTPET